MGLAGATEEAVDFMVAADTLVVVTLVDIAVGAAMDTAGAVADTVGAVEDMAGAAVATGGVGTVAATGEVTVDTRIGGGVTLTLTGRMAGKRRSGHQRRQAVMDEHAGLQLDATCARARIITIRQIA